MAGLDGQDPKVWLDQNDCPLRLLRMARASSPAKSDTIAELEVARQSLAANIDAIGERVSPANVARRQLQRARGVFQGADGSLNTRNVAIAAGVVGVLVLYAVRKRRL